MNTANTLNALINLTDEPDANLYEIIANAIISFSDEALPLLKENLGVVHDLYHRNRIESLIYTIEYQCVVEKIRQWRNKRSYDLAEPYFILSRHRFPNADWSNIGFRTMVMVEQAEDIISDNLTPLEKVRALNHIIYKVNKFRGDIVSVNNPDYYFINTLFETNVGNPLSLGLLYSIIAERLRLPIYGVDLPQHFILAYTKQTDHHPLLEDVLFYINPFNDGLVLTRDDIRKYLGRLKIQPRLKYFEPATNTHIIEKLFNTLIDIYTINGKENEADEMREMLELYN